MSVNTSLHDERRRGATLPTQRGTLSQHPTTYLSNIFKCVLARVVQHRSDIYSRHCDCEQVKAASLLRDPTVEGLVSSPLWNRAAQQHPRGHRCVAALCDGPLPKP